MGTRQDEVESFDLRETSEERLREIHAFEGIMDVEATPEDPGRSFDNYLAAVRSIPRFIDTQGLVVRDSLGVVAGNAFWSVLKTILILHNCRSPSYPGCEDKA